MSEEDDEDDQSAPKGRWLLLNSGRLNASHLQLVAQALDLPTGLCSDELRQIIDGKLTDMEHEPINVQVVRTRTELQVLLVVDKTGTFLKCGPLLLDVAGQVEELGEAKRQLEEVCQRNAELEMLLHRRGEDLQLAVSCEKERADKAEERERERANKASSKQHSAEQTQEALEGSSPGGEGQLWKRSCQQLAEQETLLTQKEQIAQVKVTKPLQMPLREHYDYHEPEEETGAITAADEPMPGVMSHVQMVHPPPDGECSAGPHQPRQWRGKTPPPQ